jgi:hypothetical protein
MNTIDKSQAISRVIRRVDLKKISAMGWKHAVRADTVGCKLSLEEIYLAWVAISDTMSALMGKDNDEASR